MGEVAPISLKTQDGETQEAMGVAWMWGQDVPTTDWDCKSQLRSRAFHRILSWVLKRSDLITSADRFLESRRHRQSLRREPLPWP